MKGSITDRTIALAGVFQAADLVREVSHSGNANPHDLETSLNSLLVEDPPDTESVFGNLIQLRRGLEVLIAQLGVESTQRDIETTRYVVGILHLERKLARRGDLMARIFSGLEDVRAQLSHFPITHENMLARLGQLYADTISTLSPRIMVTGEPLHLNNEANANKIRAILLAGFRAAVLFRQVGGRRWHILFQRGRYVAAAEHLLHTELPRRYS